MNRPGGIPLIFWIGGLAVGIGGFAFLRKRSASSGAASPATASKTGQPAFSQAQEVQDFQVFSALTSAQQGSDLSFLTEVAGLFGGGSSTAGGSTVPTGSGGGSGTPSPPSTGTAPPATTPASTGSAPAASLPGYGAGLSQLEKDNPGLANAGGISGYTVSYNGVPI